MKRIYERIILYRTLNHVENCEISSLNYSIIVIIHVIYCKTDFSIIKKEKKTRTMKKTRQMLKTSVAVKKKMKNEQTS